MAHFFAIGVLTFWVPFAIFSFYQKHSQGIQYILMLVPAKTSIYPEYIASGSYKVRETLCNQLEAYLQEHTTVEVVNTKQALLENKNAGKLYFKHDTHWTQLGSYSAYQRLKERLENLGIVMKDFPIAFLEGQTEEGDLSSMLGSPSIMGSETMPYAQWDVTTTLVQEGQLYEKLLRINSADQEAKGYPLILLENDSAPNGVALIYGDSLWKTRYSLPNWLGESFQTVVSTRFRHVSIELEEAVKPDVVIYSCSERTISYYLTKPVGVPRLADSLPEFPYKDMITAEEYGGWMLDNGLWLDTYNGSPIENSKEISLDPRSKSVKLYGWGADFYVNAPFKEIYLKIGDKLLLCDTGIERPKVATGFGTDDMLKVGFQVEFPTSFLEDGGETEISFIGVSADGQYLYTPVTYKLLYQ